MSTRLKVTVWCVVLIGAALGAVAVSQWNVGSEIGGPGGLVFWIVVVLLASSAPVRLPGGLMATVSTAPLVAVAVLGGPAAAAIVGALGTTELREVRGLVPWLRGGVPWYGTLYNHAITVIPAVLAGVLFDAVIGRSFEATASHLAAVLFVSIVYVSVNYALASLALGIRDGEPPYRVLIAGLRQSGAGLIALAPFSWLMAAVYVIAGPIGILPFFLPLYTTRDGYQKVVEIRDMFTQTVKSLASAVDAKDPLTAGHSVRVQAIAHDLGAALHCNDKQIEALDWGGLLHDIGKIGVPDAILLKQGILTKEERVTMNTHPVKGEEIIRPVAKLAPELPVIRHHHEWFDGSGYPDGLAGDQIPWLARIIHVADAFEAMTSARPYRMTPLSELQAVEELHRFEGIQFDPVVVAAFERVLARQPAWSRPDEPRTVPTRELPALGEVEASGYSA